MFNYHPFNALSDVQHKLSHRVELFLLSRPWELLDPWKRSIGLNASWLLFQLCSSNHRLLEIRQRSRGKAENMIATTVIASLLIHTHDIYSFGCGSRHRNAKRKLHPTEGYIRLIPATCCSTNSSSFLFLFLLKPVKSRIANYPPLRYLRVDFRVQALRPLDILMSQGIHCVEGWRDDKPLYFLCHILVLQATLPIALIRLCRERGVRSFVRSLIAFFVDGCDDKRLDRECGFDFPRHAQPAREGAN
jgi:hypothetical protein